MKESTSVAVIFSVLFVCIAVMFLGSCQMTLEHEQKDRMQSAKLQMECISKNGNWTPTSVMRGTVKYSCVFNSPKTGE